MKTGFQIQIQKDLSYHEHNLSADFANDFISRTCGNSMKYALPTSGGYRSYLRRKRFGFLFDADNTLVFRRISPKQRKFGIVKADTLVEMSGNDINLNKCMCPIHLGSTKVKWKDKRPEMNIYATIGDIKG